jgi:hypothetical protein
MPLSSCDRLIPSRGFVPASSKKGARFGNLIALPLNGAAAFGPWPSAGRRRSAYRSWSVDFAVPSVRPACPAHPGRRPLYVREHPQ